MSQNNPLVLVGFCQNLYHHASNQKQSSQYFIGFSYEKSAGHRYRQCFLFGNIMYKNVHNLFTGATSTEEKWRLLVSPPAASSIITQVPHCEDNLDWIQFSLLKEASVMVCLCMIMLLGPTCPTLNHETEISLPGNAWQKINFYILQNA
jgi:hypothetical protein